MKVESKEIYNTMKKIQEPKGYYFNSNSLQTSEFLYALLVKRNIMGIWVVPAGF